MKLYINKTQYGYSTTCKDKQGDLKTYMDLQFKKGEEPKTDQIEIDNAFFSCYQSKDGIKPKMIVMSYAEIGKGFEEGQAPREERRTLDDQPFADFGDTVELSEEDIAF
jgi:hypothetical protein